MRSDGNQFGTRGRQPYANRKRPVTTRKQYETMIADREEAIRNLTGKTDENSLLMMAKVTTSLQQCRENMETL